MAALGPGTKTILPYLQKADEVKAKDPLVAYYCRLYALDIGVKKNADRQLLNALIGYVDDTHVCLYDSKLFL